MKIVLGLGLLALLVVACDGGARQHYSYLPTQPTVDTVVVIDSTWDHHHHHHNEGDCNP